MTDTHVCPMVDPGPKPHVGGPVLPPGAPTVLIGTQPAARFGDMAQCASPAPDTITAGAFPVPIEKKPASRITDATAHGGTITSGFPTVLIGLAGTTGNPRLGTAACQAAALGRAGNSPTQGYNNCGVETSRQIINQATGANLTENGLLTDAIANGFAGGTPGGPLTVADGTGVPAQRVGLLGAHGVPATEVPPTMQNLGLGLSQGSGVAVDVWQGNMPAPPYVAGIPPNTGGHTVLATGAVYDDSGKMTDVIINDTATGTCGQVVPANTLQNALIGGGNSLVVTSNPIW